MYYSRSVGALWKIRLRESASGKDGSNRSSLASLIFVILYQLFRSLYHFCTDRVPYLIVHSLHLVFSLLSRSILPSYPRAPTEFYIRRIHRISQTSAIDNIFRSTSISRLQIPVLRIPIPVFRILLPDARRLCSHLRIRLPVFRIPKSVLFLLPVMVLIPPVHSLSCLTCLHTHGTNQLDNFRVSTRLARPLCPMEPIKCDRDQDVCVTITMHMGNGEYWMGAGCDRRANFQHLNCQNTKTVSRTVQMGYAHERRAMQRVCVCNSNLCNSTRPDSPLFSLLAPLILLAIFILR